VGNALLHRDFAGGNAIVSTGGGSPLLKSNPISFEIHLKTPYTHQLNSRSQPTPLESTLKTLPSSQSRQRMHWLWDLWFSGLLAMSPTTNWPHHRDPSTSPDHL